MSAADEIVMAIRIARAAGKPETEVAAIVRRMANTYTTGELLGAKSQLEAELARGAG